MIDYPDTAWFKQQLPGFYAPDADPLRTKALFPTLFNRLLRKVPFIDSGLFTASKSAVWRVWPLLAVSTFRPR